MGWELFKIIEATIEIIPAALPFSFSCECEEYMWFNLQTMFTITFVPFWNILHILQAENRHGKCYSTWPKYN